MATSIESRRWKQLLGRPDLAVAAARRGDPLGAQVLAHIPLRDRLEAERIIDRQAVDRAFASDLVATARGVGAPGSCCQACAEGRACEGKTGKLGACCQACAEGRACEGKTGTVGAADDSCYGCPPGMKMVPTPAAIPNRFICVFDNQAPPDPSFPAVPGRTWLYDDASGGQPQRELPGDVPAPPAPPGPPPGTRVPASAPPSTRAELPGDVTPSEVRVAASELDLMPGPGTVGDIAALQASMGPYSPFSQGVKPEDLGLAPGSPEGEYATTLIGNIDVNAEAVGAAQIAGGVVGGGLGGPIGAAVGSILIGTVASSLANLINPPGGCDAVCMALKEVDAVATQVCLVQADGSMDGACRDAVYNALLTFHTWSACYGCGDGPGDGSFWKQSYAGDAQALAAQYGLPPGDWDGPGGPRSLLKAMIGAAAAKRHMADDVDWAVRVMTTANQLADTYVPQCSSCDMGCPLSVRSAAILIALAENPYRYATPSLFVTGLTSASEQGLQGLVLSSQSNHQGCQTKGTYDTNKANCEATPGNYYDPTPGKCVTPADQAAAEKALEDAFGGSGVPVDTTPPDPVMECQRGGGVYDAASGRCGFPGSAPPAPLIPSVQFAPHVHFDPGLTDRGGEAGDTTPAASTTSTTSKWWYVAGAVGLAAAGWTGYRVYKKQPVIPPKATAYVKAIPAKVKGVFKGKKK
jgi:hypothetical protein